MKFSSSISRYRNRLLVSTAMAGATLLGCGENSFADCTDAAPSNYVCSGANTTGQIVPDTITFPLDISDAPGLLALPASPSVTTDPTFSVNTSDPFALGILGSGVVSYTDANPSALTSTTGVGLGVVSLVPVPQFTPPYFSLGPNPGGAVTIDTNGRLTGALIGLAAINTGDGATDIKATGDITATGSDGYGVVVYSQGGGSTISTGKVTGGTSGIYTINQGLTADLSVTATGDITATGADGYGIYAINGGPQLDVPNTILNGSVTFVAGPPLNAGKDLTVQAQGAVTGGKVGIYAENDGTGDTSVTATGVVTGTGAGSYGVHVVNGTTANDLTVNVAGVTAEIIGIVADNQGSGDTSVTATGPVTGRLATGIAIGNRATGKDVTLNADAVTGAYIGISASNLGTGATNITTSGPVKTFGFAGIQALTSTTTTGDLTLDAMAVDGGNFGVYAENKGSGATKITTKGDVLGADIGILAVNGGIATFSSTDGSLASVAGGLASTDLTVDARAVSGGRYGVYAYNGGTDGTRTTSVKTSGTVEGSVAAIRVESLSGQAIDITTSGVVRNASQLSSDVAVTTTGGPVTLTNNGGITGKINFDGGGVMFNNNATWNTAGAGNVFGGAEMINAAGVDIIAAAIGGTTTTATVLDGLVKFTNKGRLMMANGIAGDFTRQNDGDAIFEAGSVLAVDISGAGQADRFLTTGTADLSGATLAVSANGVGVGQFRVLTADSGLGGTEFASVTGITSTAFLSVTDTYDANNAYLNVIKVRDFADAGQTRNQIATGEGLDSLTSGTLFNAVAGLATDAEARAAFDQLSGEIHASANGMLVEDSRFVRDAATSRIRTAFGDTTAATLPVMAYGEGGPEMVAADTDRFAVWGQGFGSWGTTVSDGNAAAFDRSTGGLLAGTDTLVGGWRVGLLGGYSHSNFDADDRNSSGDADNYHLGLYGGTNWGAIAFRTGAAYSWSSLSTKRSVGFNGLADQLSADYDAGTAQIFGEFAYKTDASQFKFEPFANLAYVRVHTDGFMEEGGAAALTSSSSTTDATFTTLGLRGSTNFALGTINATARGMLGWQHAFGDTKPLSTLAFAGSDTFTIAGVPIARDAAVIEAGFDLKMAANATLGLSYSGQFGGGSSDNGARVNLGVKF
ncbi:autotransporter domain-containing protein [Mesorhizobium sp. B2-3-12]|uniref:autotransporter domain-containing protein n=1 Tax=Mesorhizobium sp. B2-3-12 TaxID=2589952 RepID=UPI0015E42115|nr:autotransporter domain-containing protein [Mesorhizobium sp. B2-3-12]